MEQCLQAVKDLELRQLNSKWRRDDEFKHGSTTKAWVKEKVVIVGEDSIRQGVDGRIGMWMKRLEKKGGDEKKYFNYWSKWKIKPLGNVYKIKMLHCSLLHQIHNDIDKNFEKIS